MRSRQLQQKKLQKKLILIFFDYFFISLFIMKIGLTDILITIFLVLLYKLMRKNPESNSSFILDNVDNFEETNVLELLNLEKINNNIKFNLTKNNNSFDLVDNQLVYKIVNKNKNVIRLNQKKYFLNKIIIDVPKLKYKNKLVDLEIKLDFKDITIIIPIIQGNNNLELFRIDHFDTYQSGNYLVNNLPITIQNVINKGKVINIWFYPLVDFIKSNTKLYKNDNNQKLKQVNYYTDVYYLNIDTINKIKQSFQT
jgi:hypothetical protein